MPSKVKKIAAAKKTIKKKPAAKKKTTSKVRKPVVQPPQAPPQEKVMKKRTDYSYAVGRRKRSIARIRMYKTGDGSFTINSRPSDAYFPNEVYQRIIKEPLAVVGAESFGSISVRVSGGGARGQAESIRLGISRALLQQDESRRAILKSHSLLTVDSRVKERKKYGLRKARRAPQWQKR